MRIHFMRALVVVTFVPVCAAGQSPDVPVRLMLFADATFSETERAVPDGFSLGQVVGHMNATLGPRLFAFVEGTLTPTATSPTATLERVIVRYEVADWLKLSAGRYHTPVSWWNTAYHHGSWLHSSIGRPRVVAFGTWLVPIHFLGVLAEGALHGGPVIVVYEVGAGNGRQANPSVPGDSGDDDGTLAVLGGLRFRSLEIPGVEFGVHAYRDAIRDGTGGRADEHIFSAHMALQGPLELAAEYILIRHTSPADGDSWADTHARYAHVGFRLPAGLEAVRAYVRYENIRPADDDPVFGPAFAPTPDASYDALIAGLRWDFSEYAALKAEYRDERIADAGVADDGRSLLLNVSFVIPNLLRGSSPSIEAH